MKKIKSQSYSRKEISPIVFMFKKQSMGLILMGFLVLASAMGVVYTKHLNRNLHTQLQQLQNLRGKLHVEWTQLLLEEGTVGSDIRVYEIATKVLGMTMPPETVVIQP